ncbi:MAG TPA: TonB-dependent receptor plug domain-containing protein, partial [Gemmatimonadaceae bacterium]
LLRTIPGIRVSSTNGQAQVYSTRTASQDGCVTIYVDGAPWSSLEPGDLDSFVRPNEVAAIEVYNGTSVPPQFTTPGQSCASVVVWTKTRVQTRSR